MNSAIYKITINNKVYIGSAIDFKSRKRQHLHYLKNNKHQNIHLQRLFNKHDDFLIEIVEYCEPSLLIQREQYYIDTLSPEINILKIAGSRLGSKHSEEAKRKMKGRKMPNDLKERLIKINTGKKHTDEHKSKISKSLKKENLKYLISCAMCKKEIETSEKSKKYCSIECYLKSLKGKKAWNKGIPCKEETKLKLRLKTSGVNSPRAKFNNETILDVKEKRQSGVSVIQIAKEYDVDRTTIYSLINGISYASMGV